MGDLVLLLNASLKRTLLGKLTSIALVLEDAELVACCRNGLQAKDLDSIRRASRLYIGSVLVEHGADTTIGSTRN